MSTTRAAARDAISKLVNDAATAYNVGKTGDNVLQVFWDDVDRANASGKGPQLRVFVRHQDGEQQTLAGIGNRLFRRTGRVTVQVMTPFGDGFTLDDTLATLARNCFEGVTVGDVWFRQVGPGREAGKTGGWNQTNVTASFEYTERR